METVLADAVKPPAAARNASANVAANITPPADNLITRPKGLACRGERDLGLSKNSLHRVLPNATHTSIIEEADSVNSSQSIRDVIESVRGSKVRDSLPQTFP